MAKGSVVLPFGVLEKGAGHWGWIRETPWILSSSWLWKKLSTCLLIRSIGTEVLGTQIRRQAEGAPWVDGVPKGFGRADPHPCRRRLSAMVLCFMATHSASRAPREGGVSLSGASWPQRARSLSHPVSPARPGAARWPSDGAVSLSSHCARRQDSRTDARCCAPIDAGG